MVCAAGVSGCLVAVVECVRVYSKDFIFSWDFSWYLFCDLMQREQSQKAITTR